MLFLKQSDFDVIEIEMKAWIIIICVDAMQMAHKKEKKRGTKARQQAIQHENYAISIVRIEMCVH